MKDWIHHLSFREKQIVLFGGALLCLILIYLLIWNPVATKIDFLRQHVAQNRHLLLWMQSAERRIHFLEQDQTKNVQSHSAASILGFIQNNIRSSVLEKSLTQLKLSENETVQLNFQNVSFNLFIDWLNQICQKQHLMVSRIIVKENDTAGMVSVDLRLQSG